MTSKTRSRYAMFCCVVSGCTAGGNTASQSRSPDSAFAAVQQRGAAVMGVDQHTSKHVFEDLPEGGRIVLDRDDPGDTAAVDRIRAHMRDVAADFTNGDFTRPFAIHAVNVPGTDVMASRSRNIRYTVIDRPAGAEVRISSPDSAAVAAIHTFLSFQRSDHRAPGHESAGSHKQ